MLVLVANSMVLSDESRNSVRKDDCTTSSERIGFS